jgi:GST-like protein
MRADCRSAYTQVTMLLEELHAALGVEYDAWNISIFNLEQFGSDFVALNPNSKIPCMADHEFDPPLRVFESGHILKVRR